VTPNSNRPFAAIFLSDESQETLVRWWQDVMLMPLLGTVYAHHVTLVYDPSQTQLEQVTIGAEATVEVIGWAADEHGQAVLVRSFPVSINEFPHVTVSTDGTPPVYSNTLLKQGFTPVAGPRLTGVVDVRV
jgi:hypothetical protein